MRIYVLSEDAAKKYKHDDPHVFVSITAPDFAVIKLPENPNRLDLLRLVFHDCDVDDPNCLGMKFLKGHKITPVPFLREDAERIKALVDKHPGVDVLVNCQMGISRSAGVAAAVSKALTGDDTQYFRRYTPNMHVYRIVYEVFTGQNPSTDAGKIDVFDPELRVDPNLELPNQ